MFDPSSFVNPTSLAHADTSRDVLPRGGTSHTDQKPLTYAFKQKPDKCTPCQLRHLDYISQFSTDIRYVVGTEKKVADALSRVENDAIIKPPILDYKKFAQTQLHDSEIQSFLKADSSTTRKTIFSP
ncbi:transposon Tf2-11 polyprotein [Trichonephila clavipes]|nr:transposon Tf2-11 polyprotein [Trichonephila clavipes]